MISDKKLTADFPEKGDKERIKTVLNKFEREGLLQYDLQQITFTDKAALKYVHGGWLEEHVLSAVKDIKGLQDYALGGEIIKLGATASKQKQDGKADNELDVIVLMNNNLHIIECKTVNYTSPFNKGEGNNVIYRLQAFQEQELGGLKTKVALVPVPAMVAPPIGIGDRCRGQGQGRLAQRQSGRVPPAGRGFDSRVFRPTKHV